MRMPVLQLHNLPLDLGRGLVGMTPRSQAAIMKAFETFHLIPPHPLVAGLARNAVYPAQLRHRVLCAVILQNKPRPLLHYIRHFPGHGSFYLPSALNECVTYLTGTFCYILARFVPTCAARVNPCPSLG